METVRIAVINITVVMSRKSNDRSANWRCRNGVLCVTHLEAGVRSRVEDLLFNGHNVCIYIYIFFFFLLWRCDATRVMAYSFLRFF